MVRKSLEDPIFKKQVSEAKPETQQFMNAMMKTFEEIELHKAPNQDEDEILLYRE